jgi:5'-deoxynucleotidase YfbR-like HD superfamily hydrolase
MSDHLDNDGHWSAAMHGGDLIGPTPDKQGAHFLIENTDVVKREIGTNKELARRPLKDCIKRNDRDWIQTFTGRRFWPLAPRVSDVCIEDIAHALSNLCRFTGHTLKFYSVAQHSLLCSYIVPPVDSLWALFHDAAEAYLVDFPRPVKYHPSFRQAYGDAEDRLARVIAEAFSLGWPMPDSVKRADRVLLETERRDVMRKTDLAWTYTGDCEPLSLTIEPLPPDIAERWFLRRFKELTDARFVALRQCKLLPRCDHELTTAV